MKYRQSLIFVFFFLLPVICFAQAASRTDGVNVFYYDSLFEAVTAAVGVSIERPDEIILLADVVLDEPLIVDDGVHIRLVPGGVGLSETAPHRTIRRSGNLIEYPVIWVRGEGSSLSLGKPDMRRTRTEPLSGVASTMRGSPLHELIIDGGRLNSPPIEAHAPLIALTGPDAKLIMYDRVVLQNNLNNGAPLFDNYYQNGAGVFIRTQGDVSDRQAEFIMKGGSIRGNINDVQTPLGCSGGVLIYNVGIFTMEGGAIMNNTGRVTGGGFYSNAMGSIKKTGGVIYGSNAPAGYRNTALNGTGTPKTYGHAVGVGVLFQLLTGYRDDTVGENDNLTFTGNVQGDVIFGKGEKWDNPNKASLRMLTVIILPVLALAAGVFLIIRKRTLKLAKIIQKAADTAPYIDLEGRGLTNREKEICELLLTDCTLKEISGVLGIGYSGATFHAQNLYAKLGIKGRTELLVRIKKMRNEK
jgi:DNA-binding CsgD family transcriptional regulator